LFLIKLYYIQKSKYLNHTQFSFNKNTKYTNNKIVLLLGHTG